MPIDIFESFYKQCISNLSTLTEAKVKRTIPVMTYDSVDEWIKSNILSDEDNEIKTSTALAFLLGSDMRKYVTKTCCDRIKQYFDESEANRLLGTSNSDNFNDLFEQSNFFKKYFLKFWKKRHDSTKIDLSEIDALDSAKSRAELTDFFKDTIGEEYKTAAYGYAKTIAFFLNLGIIQYENVPDDEEFTPELAMEIVKRNKQNKNIFTVLLTDASDRDFSKLITSLKIFAKHNAPEMEPMLFYRRQNILNVATFVQFLNLFGVPQNKMRNCPAFTNEMNADEDMESSKKYFNVPMANTFRPSRDQMLAVKKFVKDGDTIETAIGSRAASDLRSAAQDIVDTWDNYRKTVRSMEEYFGNYEATKVDEASLVLSILGSKIENVPDFYNKFSRIVNFISDGSIYGEQDFINRNTYDSKEIKEKRSEFLNKIKETKAKVKKSFLEHLNPIFSEIIMHSQLMYGHRTNVEENGMSTKRFLNPITNVKTNFIIPTKDLKSAIEKERYRLAFMKIDDPKASMNMFMRPETLKIDQNDIVTLTPMDNLTKIVTADVMKQLRSVDTKSSEQAKSIERQYYVDEESMKKFLNSIKKENISENTIETGDGKTTKQVTHYLPIGTYINEFHNHNTVVRFQNHTADAKSAWENTRVEIQKYHVGTGVRTNRELPSYDVVQTYVITTPITEMNYAEISKLLDHKKNNGLGGPIQDQMTEKVKSDLGSEIEKPASDEDRLRKLFQTSMSVYFHEWYDDYHGGEEPELQSLKDFKDNIDSFCASFCSASNLIVKNEKLTIDAKNLFNAVLPNFIELIDKNASGLFLGMMYWQTQHQGDAAFYESGLEEKREDDPLNDLNMLRYDTKNNFIQRGQKLTSRALNMSFGENGEMSDEDIGIFHADNMPSALGNILNYVLSYSFVANQYPMSANYIKRYLSGGGNPKAIEWLNHEIESAASKIALRGATNPPQINVMEIVQSLNSIGEQYIDAIYAIMADGSFSYNLNLNFTPCTAGFAKILRDIPAQSGGDENLEYAMKTISKICYVASYLIFLMFSLAKKNEVDTFPVKAQVRTNREEKGPPPPESAPSDTQNSLALDPGDVIDIDF